MIRTVLIDDQELVRVGLQSIVERDGDIAVVAEADNGKTGVNLVREHRPDVVLMDIRMPRQDGIDACREITADPRLFAVRVIMLTTFDGDAEIQESINAGASGYVLKDASPEELRNAIRTVAGGEALLSPSVTRKVLVTLASRKHSPSRPELIEALTPRERDVLTRIGLGESNAEIGAALHISPDTSRTYVSRLLAKLHARDRTQLVVIAYESGAVTLGSDLGVL